VTLWVNGAAVPLSAQEDAKQPTNELIWITAMAFSPELEVDDKDKPGVKKPATHLAVGALRRRLGSGLRRRRGAGVRGRRQSTAPLGGAEAESRR
jgi:hypothetical protein